MPNSEIQVRACESASNFDPRLDGRRPLNGNSFLGNWRGPDRRRSGPRLYGPFSLEINTLGKF